MTVSNTTASVTYAGDGTTTSLAVPYYFLQVQDLLVQQINTLVSPPSVTTLVRGTDYTVAGAGVESGGTVLLTVPAIVGTNTVIGRNLQATQNTHYVPNDPFPASTHEAALDKLTMLIQQALLELGFAVTLPPSVGGSSISGVLPYPSASQFLAWDPTGNFLVNGSPTGVGPGTIVDSLVAVGAGIQSTKLNFLNTLGSAISRTVGSKLQDIVSVKDYGAKGDGATNDLAAIQACINANPSATIYFPAGTYIINAAIVISGANPTLTALGRGSATIKTTNLTDDIIRITLGAGNLTGIAIDNLVLDASAPKTSGYGINVTSTGGALYNSKIERIFMTANMFSGLQVQSALFLSLNDIMVFGIGSNGTGFHFIGHSFAAQVANVHISNCRVAAGTSGGLTIGFLFDSWTQGFYSRYLSAESSGIDFGVYITDSQNTGSSLPMNMLFEQVICDSNNLNGFNITSGRTMRFSDCWTTSCKQRGVDLAGSVDFEFRGHVAISSGLDGMRIQSTATQTRIVGGVFDANSQTTPNTAAGISVNAGATDFSIIGADFFRAGTTKSQLADIFVATGASDRYVIIGNRVEGGLTSKIVDGGTGANKSIISNPGYNPQGTSVATPSLPASGVNVTNTFGFPVAVSVAGTVTAMDVNSVFLLASAGTVVVPAGATVSVTYTGTPVWRWVGIL